MISVPHGQSQDVIGCGGFIKSKMDINYKVVRIQLITKDGIPVYTTEAAPINGYYMIPVYERGEYILKIIPPPGWSFVPNQMELNIDGETDPCSLNQDLNFVFKGFGLAGKVISAGSTTGGPSGVKLTLYQNTNKLNETISKSDGTFEFFDVLPGDYTVKATHDHWKFITDVSNVQLSKERWEIEHPIVVRGYTVKTNPSSMITCDDRSLPTDFASPGLENDDFLCRTKTNDKGEYIFQDVPVGIYSVLAYYHTSTMDLNFVPTQKSLTVFHKDFIIQLPFETSTVSFSGRVVKMGKLTDDAPLSNVVITVDQKPCCKSDANGYFLLENIRSNGNIKVKAELDGYIFKDITHAVNLNKMISTNERMLVIAPEKVRVTGTVQISTKLSDTAKKQTIRYYSKVDGQKQNMKKLEVDPNTKYVVYLTPGTYTFSPELTDSDIRSGLHLTPEEIDVQIKSEPIDDINFSQLKAKLNGKIKCIDRCGNDLPQLLLTSLNRRVATKIDLKNQQEHKVSESGNIFEFEQDNMLPGKYILSFSPNEKITYCWKDIQMEIDLSNSNKTVTLEQTGIKLIVAIQTTNDVILNVTLKDEPDQIIGSYPLQNGDTDLCLPKKGVYELVPVSCMKFENSTYIYDSSKAIGSSAIIELIPIEYQVFISMSTPSTAFDDQIQFPIIIRNMMQNNEFTFNLNQKVGNELTGYFWAKNGEHFTLLPQSETWLFEPKQASIIVSSEYCNSNLVKFIARRGLFITGQISPPVSEANVSIYSSLLSDGDLEQSTVELDGKQVYYLSSTLTDQNGEYTFGPLIDTRQYQIKIKKAGHVFSSTSNPYNFLVEKLAEIHVKLLDELNEQPLDGVFILLTSTNNYRQSSLTNKSGQVYFVDLKPGTYYIRPQMREYDFSPSDVHFDIKSGDYTEYVFRAKRTSYSCYGIITSLNNEPENGLIIDAVGLDQCDTLRESAKSDIGGQFRLRALEPGCRYKLIHRVNPLDAQQSDIIQVEPAEKLIEISDADVENIHLYTLKRPTEVDLSVHVNTQTQFLPQLKVKLYKSSNRDLPIQTVTLLNSNFAYLNSLPFDNDSYILKLESPLSTSLYTYILPEVTFTANQTFLFFTFNFEPKLRTYDSETRQGSYLAFIIALLVIAIVFKYDTLLPILQSTYEYVHKTLAPQVITTISTSIPQASTVTTQLTAQTLQQQQTNLTHSSSSSTLSSNSSPSASATSSLLTNTSSLPLTQDPQDIKRRIVRRAD
ncbi:unnamed protein product [Didymodactylos carnosus]|uniref:Nodal modulator 1 n=1 Tax=Didymodactylos carnosus TaxID=1234261 RepID=A0A814J4S2_9BILA|nr:unnamed protein product [Didymodactylos carnosus]CAF3803911.1 unnamed protein product [Didymodactylos carnosus]